MGECSMTIEGFEKVGYTLAGADTLENSPPTFFKFDMKALLGPLAAVPIDAVRVLYRELLRYVTV